VRELGGELVPFDHGEDTRFGRFAFCKDDQGSAFGLHERPR
jgi:hypothetical protein